MDTEYEDVRQKWPRAHYYLDEYQRSTEDVANKQKENTATNPFRRVRIGDAEKLLIEGEHVEYYTELYDKIMILWMYDLAKCVYQNALILCGVKQPSVQKSVPPPSFYFPFYPPSQSRYKADDNSIFITLYNEGYVQRFNTFFELYVVPNNINVPNFFLKQLVYNQWQIFYDGISQKIRKEDFDVMITKSAVLHMMKHDPSFNIFTAKVFHEHVIRSFTMDGALQTAFLSILKEKAVVFRYNRLPSTKNRVFHPQCVVNPAEKRTFWETVALDTFIEKVREGMRWWKSEDGKQALQEFRAKYTAVVQILPTPLEVIPEEESTVIETEVVQEEKPIPIQTEEVVEEDIVFTLEDIVKRILVASPSWNLLQNVIDVFDVVESRTTKTGDVASIYDLAIRDVLATMKRDGITETNIAGDGLDDTAMVSFDKATRRMDEACLGPIMRSGRFTAEMFQNARLYHGGVKMSLEAASIVCRSFRDLYFNEESEVVQRLVRLWKKKPPEQMERTIVDRTRKVVGNILLDFFKTNTIYTFLMDAMTAVSTRRVRKDAETDNPELIDAINSTRDAMQVITQSAVPTLLREEKLLEEDSTILKNALLDLYTAAVLLDEEFKSSQANAVEDDGVLIPISTSTTLLPFEENVIVPKVSNASPNLVLNADVYEAIKNASKLLADDVQFQPETFENAMRTDVLMLEEKKSPVPITPTSVTLLLKKAEPLMESVRSDAPMYKIARNYAIMASPQVMTLENKMGQGNGKMSTFVQPTPTSAPNFIIKKTQPIVPTNVPIVLPLQDRSLSPSNPFTTIPSSQILPIGRNEIGVVRELLPRNDMVPPPLSNVRSSNALQPISVKQPLVLPTPIPVEQSSSISTSSSLLTTKMVPLPPQLRPLSLSSSPSSSASTTTSPNVKSSLISTERTSIVPISTASSISSLIPAERSSSISASSTSPKKKSVSFVTRDDIRYITPPSSSSFSSDSLILSTPESRSASSSTSSSSSARSSSSSSSSLDLGILGSDDTLTPSTKSVPFVASETSEFISTLKNDAFDEYFKNRKAEIIMLFARFKRSAGPHWSVVPHGEQYFVWIDANQKDEFNRRYERKVSGDRGIGAVGHVAAMKAVISEMQDLAISSSHAFLDGVYEMALQDSTEYADIATASGRSRGEQMSDFRDFFYAKCLLLRSENDNDYYYSVIKDRVDLKDVVKQYFAYRDVRNKSWSEHSSENHMQKIYLRFQGHRMYHTFESMYGMRTELQRKEIFKQHYLPFIIEDIISNTPACKNGDLNWDAIMASGTVVDEAINSAYAMFTVPIHNSNVSSYFHDRPPTIPLDSMVLDDDRSLRKVVNVSTFSDVLSPEMINRMCCSKKRFMESAMLLLKEDQIVFFKPIRTNPMFYRLLNKRYQWDVTYVKRFREYWQNSTVVEPVGSKMQKVSNPLPIRDRFNPFWVDERYLYFIQFGYAPVTHVHNGEKDAVFSQSRTTYIEPPPVANVVAPVNKQLSEFMRAKMAKEAAAKAEEQRLATAKVEHKEFIRPFGTDVLSMMQRDLSNGFFSLPTKAAQPLDESDVDVLDALPVDLFLEIVWYFLMDLSTTPYNAHILSDKSTWGPYVISAVYIELLLFANDQTLENCKTCSPNHDVIPFAVWSFVVSFIMHFRTKLQRFPLRSSMTDGQHLLLHKIIIFFIYETFFYGLENFADRYSRYFYLIRLNFLLKWNK